jgi:alkylation response protein AidB-like acyl-CoA dehydrogenase
MIEGWTPQVGELGWLLARVVGVEDLLAARGLTDDDLTQVLAEAGRFAEGVIAPLNRVGDRHGATLANGVVTTAPGWVDAYRRFAEAGWCGIAADPVHGGQGLPLALATATTELWNTASLAFALCPLLSQAAMGVLERFANADQRRRWLEPLVAGRWTGTMNLTEPQAGSDLAQVRTRATPHPDGGHRVHGQKIYITYGDHDLTENIVHLVLARLPDGPPGIKGLSLFVVPKRLVRPDGGIGPANNVRVLGLEHKLGIHASPTCTLAFGEDGGAVAELLGEPHRGIEYMFTMMNHARLAVGVQGVAIAERALAAAAAYARGRIQGRPIGGRTGDPIAAHPDLRRMLGVSRAEILAARALALETAALLDRGAAGDAAAQARGDLLIPVVKAWATDLGVAVASTAIQIHGGMGFIEETGAAQHLRDARITPIYEGTNGIQAADLLGRKLLRDNGRTMAALVADGRATAAALAEAPGDDATTLASELVAATDALDRACHHLTATAEAAPADAAAVAVPLLELVGVTAGGWMIARVLAAAIADQGRRGADHRRLDHMVQLARLYADHILPRTAGLARTIVGGSRAVAALDLTMFDA